MKSFQDQMLDGAARYDTLVIRGSTETAVPREAAGGEVVAWSAGHSLAELAPLEEFVTELAAGAFNNMQAIQDEAHRVLDLSRRRWAAGWLEGGEQIEQVPDSAQALEAAHKAIGEGRFPDAIKHLHYVMNCLHAECSEHVIQLAGLLVAFEAALELKPFLWLEIGYNRVSGWMITVYDKAAGVERVAVQAEGLRTDDTCQAATRQLRALAGRSDHA